MPSRKWDSKLLRTEILRARTGTRYASALFGLKIVLADRLRSGILLVASKKRVHKKAVVRNRAKRRLRAALDLVEFPTPTLAIININQGVVDAKFTTLVAELRGKYAAFYRMSNRATQH